MPVGEVDAAAARRIAGDRAVLAHQRAPEERHQPGAARLGRRRPEALVDRLVLEPVAGLELRADDRGVEAAEDLFDARAVERDQDHRRPRRR